MPPRIEDQSKSKARRRRYVTQVVDPATQARLTPMPPTPAASSSQGSTGSSQASVAAPPIAPAFSTPAFSTSPYLFPQGPPGYHFGSSPSFPYPGGYPFPYPTTIPPQTQLQIQPQQINTPQPQQNPPQPEQENVVEEDGAGQMDGGGEVVQAVDEPEVYPMDNRNRFILKPSGNSFLPCKPAAEAIKNIIHNCYNKLWKTYGDVDDDEKERWFNLFQAKCTWDARYYETMRCNFHIRAAARLSDMLRNARVRYEEKKKRPHWIGRELMSQLVDYWATEEFKSKSEKAKKNRASEKGGCIHTGGCISNGEHAERLARRLGREPFINELHNETHRHKSGQFCDERARKVQEEYDRQLAEALSQGSTVNHGLSLRTWTKVAGDKTKGKLYGAGNLAANYRKGVAASLRLTLNHGEGSSHQPELTPEMRELIQRLTQEQLTQQMASHQAVVQDLLERQRSYEEQLAQFRQARAGSSTGEQMQVQDPAHTRAPIINDNDDPYQIYGEDEEVETEDDE